MRQLGTAAIVALLAGVTWPAHAQMQTPNINPDASKTSTAKTPGTAPASAKKTKTGSNAN